MMKCINCTLKILFLFLSTSAFGQVLYNDVGHIPSAYQEDWTSAGVLHDIRNLTPKLVIVIQPGSADLQIETALTQARSHVNSTGGLAIINFLSGTYYFTDQIPISVADSNIVFQGEGADKTVLEFLNMENSNCFDIYGGNPGSWVDLNQDFNKGNSILYASSGALSGFSSGDWVHFVKYNFVYHTTNPPIEAAIVGQITQLENMGSSGGEDWVEIKDVANMNYDDSANTLYSLKIRKIAPIKNIGIEDLKIIRSPNVKAHDDSIRYNIKFNMAVNCWVRGVESDKPSRSHLSVSRSSHIEISGCFFWEAMGHGDDGWGYGVVLGASTTNCLIENNIFQKLRHSLIAAEGSNCNVWTFNYSRDQYSEGWPSTSRDLDLHAKYPFGHLFEQNVIEEIGADDSHGHNGPYNAFVRNYSTVSAELRFKKMEYWSSLGNCRTTGPLYAIGHQYDSPPIMDRFGFRSNYSLGMIHNSVAWYPSDGDACELLDVSYYYSERPYFLSTSYTWPAIGPRTSGTSLTQSIPAKARYNNTKKTYLLEPTPKPLTYSGNMPYSQEWTGTHNLTGNVIVPTYVTLTLKSGATINLNGYTLTSSGGTIVRESGAAVSPDICQKDGSTIKGFYPTIPTAITASSSGETVTVAGTHNLSCDLFVSSGVTLELPSGTTIQMSNGKKISVSSTGLLQANGVTFTGSSWYGIEFDDASTGSYIKFCTIRYATYGIRMISTNVSLTCNTVKNNGTGLYFDDHSDGSGIVNSHNISYNSSCGIRCASYSDPLIFTGNDIKDNGIGLGGVSGDGSSVFDLGCYSDQGHNNIYYNDWYDVNSSYSGTIYARYNYWGDPNPTPNVSNNVDWSSYLTSMWKANPVDSEPNQQPVIAIETEYTDTLGVSEVDAAYSQHYREKNYLEATTAFENIVNKYPDRFAGKRALSFLYKSQKHQKNESAIRPLLDQIIANYPGKAVADLAQHLTVSELLKQAEFSEAADKCQALLEKENEFTKYALFKLGNIYWYHLKDKALGEKYYRELIAAYPDHDLSISALATLGEWNPEAPKQPDPEPKDIAGNSNVKKFALLQNYPNPFNPTTTIPYQIAEDGPVSIKIFNILGEEVATLLNGDAAAGSHALQWNGLNKYGHLVANGVYWVQLQSGQLISRRKVVMLQ